MKSKKKDTVKSSSKGLRRQVGELDVQPAKLMDTHPTSCAVVDPKDIHLVKM